MAWTVPLITPATRKAAPLALGMALSAGIPQLMSGSDATCPRDITGEQASDAEAGTDENNRLASREEVAASDAQAHFAQARRFWEQRDYESAERSIRRAISVDRTDPRFYRLAGRLYAKLGRIGGGSALCPEAGRLGRA